MKFRIGFVSNSSTSSFCIFGIEIDKDGLNSLLGAPAQSHGCDHEFDRATCKFCPNCGKHAWKTNHWSFSDYKRLLTQHKLELTELDYGTYCVGIGAMGKGISQFPLFNEAAAAIKRLFGQEAKFMVGEVES